MISNAYVGAPTLASAPVRAPSRRPIFPTLLERGFWLGIIAWWVVLVLGVLRAW